MEESQRKLAQLQEHQASLVGMQLRVRERLNEARQAQQALLQQEHQNSVGLAVPLPVNVEQLESETAELRGKLAQLQTKKKNMDHLVAELQAVEISDRGSCVSILFHYLHYLDNTWRMTLSFYHYRVPKVQEILEETKLLN